MISAAGPNQLGGVSFLSPPIVLALAISPPLPIMTNTEGVSKVTDTPSFLSAVYTFIFSKILLLLLHSIF